ncbi:MAG: protein-disulfide reductase DsbD domain-containing protein [Pseudomonadota bacterium]
MFTPFVRILLLVLATGLVPALVMMAGFAQAAVSGWQDLGGGKARLVAMVDPASGELRGAVEVRLEDGWHTYWRYPGKSGIPPRFDFAGSTGFDIGAVRFPVPELLGEGDDIYAGYKSSVIFPFSGTWDPAVSPSLKLSLLIGVCEEICIPAQARFSMDSAALSITDPDATRILGAARLHLPILKTPADLDLAISSEGQSRVLLSLKASFGDHEPLLFVEGPHGWNLSPATFVGRSGERLTFSLEIPQWADPELLKKPGPVFTLVTGGSGLEFSH